MTAIATVWVTVMPETAQVAPKLKEAFRAVDKDAYEAGRRWSSEIKRGLGDVNVKVEADTSKAKTELERFRAEQERKKIRQRIEFDESDFKGKLDVLGKQFDGVAAKFASPLKLSLGLAGIGTLPALATGLVNVAGAAQQLAGAGLALPGIWAGLGSSVGTAALGMHGMKDALTAVNKAADGTQASVDAANKALSGLSPNAAETVKTVAGLKGTFTDLQHIAGQNMFAGVSQQIRTLAAADLPALTRGINSISFGLNQNILQGLTSLGSGASQGFLDRIMGNTGDAQSRLTAAIDPMIHAVGVLTAAGSDTLPRLATAVGAVADRFNNFITGADADGRLSKWINDGITGLTQLGDIALNIGKSFTAVTQAAGGGAGLLGTIESLSQRMSTFLNSTAGQNMLAQFFAQGRDTLGQLRDIVVQLAPMLPGIFDAAQQATGLWLPVIREALQIINDIPGGAQAVVYAFLAWKTIDGVTSLAGALGNVANLLRVTLPAAAAEGAGGISSALAGITAPAWLSALLAAGGLPAVTAGFALTADQILKDAPDSPENARARGVKGLASPNPRPIPGGGGPGAQAARRGSAGYTGLPVVAGPDQYGGPGAQAERRGLTPAAAAPPVTVPQVSSYIPPVVTQPSSSGGGGSTNLPYTGTADPNALASTAMPATAAAVPLTQNPNGTWTSTDPAWAHLIQRESGGINQRQGIIDANSGGNEAEGLFQITPGTWRSNGGTEFAPSAIQATPQQQAIVAARILKRNPSGSDWGAGMAGRESASGLLAGLSGTAGTSSGAFNPATSMPSTAGVTPASGLMSGDLTLRNAQQRVADTQHSEEQAQARLDEMNAKGTANARERENSEYAVAKAKREHADAIDALTVAQDKLNKQSSGKSGIGSDPSQQLGQTIGSDLMGMILPEGFKNPFEFGAWKMVSGLFNGLMGLQLPQGSVQGGDGASLSGGGGGGLSGLLGGLTGIMPQPFGNLTSGSPGNAPGEFMPAMPSPADAAVSPFGVTGSGGAAGPGNQVIDNRMQVISPIGQDHLQGMMNTANQAQIPRVRQGIRPLP
jgi:hypothetical protein